MICQNTQQGCAAVYARYSSDLQDTSSIDGQIRKARDWAKRNGFCIHENHYFVDEAISGTKNCRPGLDQMLTIAEHGEFELLIVESLSRLARSHVYASTVMMHFVYVLKIRIIGLDDGCDTNNSGWELLAGIKNILNEQYIRDLSKMVRRGHIENLMQGFSAGDLCFGYKSEPVSEIRVRGRNQTPKKRYIIDEKNAVWVRQIFDWYVNENRSLQWIAKELTRLNVSKDHRATTPSWHHAIVKRILSNRKYLGIWAWGQKRSERNPVTGRIRCFPSSPEEIVQHTRLFPELRLINDCQFAKAQYLLKNRKISYLDKNVTHKRYIHGQSKYLLSGLVKCGICGGIYQVGGKNSRYIYCHNRRHNGNCENRTQLPRVLAEKLILQEISQKILTNKRWINTIYATIKNLILKSFEGVSIKIQSKEHTMIELRQKIDHLIDQIENAPILELRQRLEKRIDELHQVELDLRELRVRAGKAILFPNRDWLLGKLDELGKILTGSAGPANLVLRNLLETPISVVPVKFPKHKRCFLRGTFQLRAERIAATLIGIDSENEIDGLVEEFVIDFKDTTFRDERRRKVSDLYRQEGWSIKKISENIGISASHASKLLKEDYQLRGDQVPDFRCFNQFENFRKEIPLDT
ncbi:MAG: recombinase family protein [Planctomycetaceae bacterium]|jgi:DNA invertase Pin-like site-specific DNA recombinase|nr:recombinase family protein [Planctomycetaceae bacterium]